MLSLRIYLRSPRSAVLAAFLWTFLPALPAVPADAQEPPLSCPSCDLAGRDLSGRDLTNANLTGADLRGASLRGADLDGAVLIGAQLQGADLDDATLNPSDRGPANLSRADLSGASLVGTEMIDADLQFAILPSREGSATPQPAALARARRGPAGPVGFAAAAEEEIACGRADLSGLTSRVYVGPDGEDGGSCGGSPETACRTIAEGIARCTGAGCGVLVAWAEYTLDVTIDLRDGVSVYGGCLPASQADPTYVSVIEAPVGGVPAVRAVAVDTPTVLQGFEIAASDVCAHHASPADCPAGTETVAVVVDESGGLSILDSQLVASVGAPGGGGADGSDGSSGGGASGRTAGTNGACSNTQGGKGASQMDADYETEVEWLIPDIDCDRKCAENNCYGFGGGAGETGVAASGGYPGSTECTASCFPDDPSPGGPGVAGLHGACGAPGEVSTTTAGTFTGVDWSPSVGGDGGTTLDGGGGAGGGAGGYQVVFCGYVDVDLGNSGGGGGAGGCAGTSGRGGIQGGGSFALVARASHVDLTGSSVISGQGGEGGRGGQGGKGGAGGTGAGGANDASGDGGDGGRGGDGGDGGSGAGGAGGNGGPTIGVALVDGATVADDDTVFYPGRSGAPGQPGSGGGAPSTDSCQGPGGQEGRDGTIVNVYDYRSN